MPTPIRTDCRRFADQAPERRSICHLDMGGDAPDTSRQDAVAERMAGMSEEQWDWVKQQYELQAPDRAAASAVARQVSQAGLDAMNLQNSVVQDYKADRDSLYRPLEQGIVADATAYDTAARREAKAAEAVADVGMQVGLARDAMGRDLARRGVAPGSGKALALGNQLALGEAASKAGAANKAREAVELQGYARKMDAANLGRGNASAQATSAGIALNAGDSATRSGVTPLSVAQGGVGMVQGGLGSALQGMGGAANIYQNSTQQRTAAGDNSGMWGALGSLGGAALMAFSDENQKTEIKDVKPEMSLAAIRRMPNSKRWKYRKDSPAADGGLEHVGPMAQDVQANLGDGTAPNGKVIDLVSMNGHLVNSVKELDRRVLSLENKRTKG